MYINTKITIASATREYKLKMHYILPFLITVVTLFTLGGCFTGCSSPSLKPAGEVEDLDPKELKSIKNLIDQGDFPEAFLRLNKALNLEPNSPDVHINLAWLYLYTENLPRARKEIQIIKTLAPNALDLPHLEGTLSQHQAHNLELAGQKGQAASLHQAAILKLRNALAQNRQSPQVYFDLASSLSAIGKNEEAMSLLDKGFDFISNDDLETQVNFQISICSLHAKMELINEAILDCEQAASFATTLEAKNRIKQLVENMKLLNPELTLPEATQKLTEETERAVEEKTP
jgi:tetratricopeptide (TPR) repeat protein